MSNIEVSEFKLPATDGFELAASLYQPADIEPNGPVVLITSATGVKRRYYDKYARFLAENGFTTVTFEYRGIGESRPRTLRGFEASLQDWAVKDIAGAIDWIVAQRHPRRLLVVGHSLGGQLIGLTPNNDRVNAMLTVAAQSGYWGLWSGPRKYFMWFLWHALMPGLTRVYSYFPSKKLGLSEDLPGGVARQWAFWGRHPHYIVDDQGNPIRKNFLSFRGPIRAYSFTDDIDAPRAAVESLVQCYENAAKELNHRSPGDLGVDAIGHFGFFREQFRSSLWTESAEWLKKQAAEAPGRAARAGR
jgi:predicted alpha/beta hydrolase